MHHEDKARVPQGQNRIVQENQVTAGEIDEFSRCRLWQ